MAVMTTLPTRREFTYADLQAMPDDGNRHEIVDGALIVAPGPILGHQRVQMRLVSILLAACPDHLELLAAPFDVKISDTTVLQPDLLVAPPGLVTDPYLDGPPLLAVEILSPSTRHIDLGLKRAVYEAAQLLHYWVVDPSVPSAIAWRLEDGAYVEAGRAEGDETLVLAAPFAVSLTPSRLLD